MPIQFACENCQKNLKVPDSAAGKRGRCNQCGHLNTIPAASADVVPAQPAAAAPAPAAAPTAAAAATPSSSATYNVKSAVNGAVFGPADSKTLKEWLDEGRITPNCQLQETGTPNWIPASQMFAALGGAGAGVAAAAAADPFASFQDPAATKANSGDLNPYAPTLNPQLARSAHKTSREIVPTSGDIGFCISHGWKVWTENFGLLLAVSATTVGINYFFNILQQVTMAGMIGAGDQTMVFVVVGVIILISALVQAWLGLGAIKVTCQLCRGERAEYSMLFSRAKRVPWLILFGIMLYLPFLLVGGGLFIAIGPEGLGPGNEEAGIAILVTVMGALAVLFVLMLMIWPIYYVLADTDMGFEMVGKGFRIGLKNCLIAIPIFFVAGLAMMMGVFACVIGVIATIPAGQAMIATAYLNMSGQLQAR